MAYGFSDLHCNQATTELMSRLVAVTDPAVVLDSGDDTVNGTAAERGCIRREAGIPGGRPFAVATGNHDSDVTEAQLRAAGATVLDGSAAQVGDWDVLGDDDPERQVPFSVERTLDRPEDEAQLGQRMVQAARTRPVDAILVHQPTAAAEIMKAPDPPAALVLWGHMHAQLGPTVVTHADGSWTVGMQQGTSGGVKQPTLASFSTPFSPPLVRADSYFYFSDLATGLVTGVQAVHLEPDGEVVVDARTDTGNVAALPPETRNRLAGETASPTPEAPQASVR
nr:metallophosphoesterase [Microlunatus antarcticus]